MFYNPAQVVNRDLSVCAIELFSRWRLREPARRGGTKAGITILEALSATGLRAIRYFKEITNVRYIIANDLDPDAVDCIARNCHYNNVPVVYPTLSENFPSDAIDVYPCEVKQSGVTGERVDGSPSDAGNATDAKRGAAVPPSSSSPVPSLSVSHKPLEGVGVKSGGAIIPNLDDAIDLMYRLGINPSVRPAGTRLCTVLPPTATESTAPHEQQQKPHLEPKPLLQQELMDVVDLDPYGTASPFLDSAFGCIKEGGLMLVTSTDSAILCGNYVDTCHAKYNSVPYKASHCHEMAVRILLAAMERVANKHKKYIVPLLSMHIDFYVRCFFRVYTQPAEVKLSPCKLGYQLQCTHCPAFWVRPLATARVRRGPHLKRRRPDSHARDASAATAKAAPRGGKANEEENTAAPRDDTASKEEQPTAQPVRAERFPSVPSRSSNPTLTALSLRQLPTVHRSTDGAPAATEDTTADEPSQNPCCPVCGSAVIMSGPIYAAPTQNVEQLQQLLDIIAERDAEKKVTATARITGLVRVAMEELPDCPLFYNLPDVASYVRVRCPQTPLVVAALARLGYRCSQVHCAPSGFKTDCPPDVLVRVMLQWKVLQDEADRLAEEGDNNDGDVDVNSASATRGGDANPNTMKDETGKTEAPTRERKASESVRLLVTPLAEADFTYDKQYDFRRQATGVTKFIPNAPGWGPKRRHQGALHTPEGDDEEEEQEGEEPIE